MIVIKKKFLYKLCSAILVQNDFLKMALGLFLPFSKVDFCVIVQKEKARASNSGNLIKLEKTKFSMKTIVPFIVSFLWFVRNNKKPTRKLNV